MRHAIIAVLLLAALAGTAVAGPSEDAYLAYERGDYATALRLLRPLAKQGDAGAQHNFGFMYANGQGVPQDYAEAARWYRRAAEQGHVGGQLKLGFTYANGWGVPRDYAEAVKWYRLAAEQGHDYAQYSLGNMYRRGQGVPQDNVQAYKWFDLAASRNVDALLNRDRVTANMTPSQVAEAMKQAREWTCQPPPRGFLRSSWDRVWKRLSSGRGAGYPPRADPGVRC